MSNDNLDATATAAPVGAAGSGVDLAGAEFLVNSMVYQGHVATTSSRSLVEASTLWRPTRECCLRSRWAAP